MDLDIIKWTGLINLYNFNNQPLPTLTSLTFGNKVTCSIMCSSFFIEFMRHLDTIQFTLPLRIDRGSQILNGS